LNPIFLKTLSAITKKFYKTAGSLVKKSAKNDRPRGFLFLLCNDSFCDIGDGTFFLLFRNFVLPYSRKNAQHSCYEKNVTSLKGLTSEIGLAESGIIR
jgi:hypothetical protein